MVMPAEATQADALLQSGSCDSCVGKHHRSFLHRKHGPRGSRWQSWDMYRCSLDVYALLLDPGTSQAM